MPQGRVSDKWLSPFREDKKPHADKLWIMSFPGKDIIQYIAKFPVSNRSILLGIDGGAGAGKTTYADWLADSLRKTKIPVSVIHVDSFYRPLVERFYEHVTLLDCDWERLRDQVIIPLRSGREAYYQHYEWLSDGLKDRIVDADGIAIIEGVNALHNELADYYDLRIWVKCPQEIREHRILERGDMSAEEIQYWMPAEKYYMTSHNPEKSAHLVIDSTKKREHRLDSGWVTERWSPPDNH